MRRGTSRNPAGGDALGSRVSFVSNGVDVRGVELGRFDGPLAVYLSLSPVVSQSPRPSMHDVGSNAHCLALLMRVEKEMLANSGVEGMQ